MLLFISYSRTDKVWVYSFCRHLREVGNHDVWIDKRIIPATDWWASIIDNIKRCDCFVVILSAESVSSIYCKAELDYALALNKPIIPLMLRPCSYPEVLSQRRIQYYTIKDKTPMDRVLLHLEQALSTIQIKINQGQFILHSAPVPKEPTPAEKAEEIVEALAIAEDALNENNITLARKLLRQIIDHDRSGFAESAKTRLSNIITSRERKKAYELVRKNVADTDLPPESKRALWQSFVNRFPNFDPSGVGEYAVLSPPKEEDFGVIKHIRRESSIYNDITVPETITLEDAYAGTTIHVENGWTAYKYPVQIPPGVESGAHIRIKDAGGPGFWSGDNGDLVVEVNVDHHRRFHRDGANLFTTINIDKDLAINGGALELPSLVGLISVQIPSNLESGSLLRLSNQGMPGGDLFITVLVDQEIPILRKSIGLKLAGGDVFTFIHSETILPTTSKATFSTSSIKQDRINLEFSYGENDRDRLVVGKYEIDVKPNEIWRSEHCFYISADVDAKRWLKITVAEESQDNIIMLQTRDLTKFELKQTA